MLYTLTTGAILTCVVIALSILNENSITKHNEDLFQTSVMNISTKLQSDSNFNISWLASTEADNSLLIHIEENTVPLLYRGSWTPKTDRNTLIQKAKEYGHSTGYDLSYAPVSSPIISPVFSLRGENQDRYDAILMSYPKKKGFVSVIILHDISSSLKQLNRQRIFFLLCDCMGIFCLFLVSRLFVEHSLRPVKESREKQQTFISAASHELRSPLMVIQASAQAIEVAPKQTAQFTSSIKRECQRMSRLVDDMLTLASSDSGNWSVSFSPVDLNTLLLDIYETYEPLCLDKGIPIHLDLSDDILPTISGDAGRLSQLLMVLLDNALYYNKEGMPILLKAYQQKSKLMIQVIDHGSGIPDDKKELIFNRFFRGDASRNDKQHFGLGLSIARELASLHNGTLTVSDTPKGGATFTLTLHLNHSRSL